MLVKQLKDAIVTRDYNGNLVAMGNVRTYPDPSDTGYNILRVTMYKMEDSIDYKVKEKLTFRVPSGFGKSKDSKGVLRLPDFTLTPAKETKIDENRSLFEMHLFYRDWTT